MIFNIDTSRELVCFDLCKEMSDNEILIDSSLVISVFIDHVISKIGNDKDPYAIKEYILSAASDILNYHLKNKVLQ